MNLSPESENLSDYLAEDSYVDYSHPLIKQKAEELFKSFKSETDRAKAAFEFVRDEISHSWDIQNPRITRKASEVLIHSHGICYIKSCLLAALLRAMKIPAGFCYQRLTLQDTPESGYCIHALSAVFLSDEKKWIRLDARGNKEGVDSQFSIVAEQLAFPVREQYDERDYPTIYMNPLKITMDTLQQNSNCLEMFMYHLPEDINTERLR